ncbi:60S acidic ribosomal protein p2 [Plakobranchus ocellatus]|uniref:Large ribosomal subunit protein P2 n=1 Tax=Plakobranchus ocellatus TaxID=259542 RepID=A0AAV4DGE2_9GAST|nr:60S acidic ribosomal protein p2 [Plakobranchus ocellatus]
MHAIANSVRSFIFDPNAPSFVTTDAYDVGLEAVLSQTQQGHYCIFSPSTTTITLAGDICFRRAESSLTRTLLCGRPIACPPTSGLDRSFSLEERVLRFVSTDLKFLRMRYVAAYLLAALGGKSVSAADIDKILSSVGIESEQEKVNKIISELQGKNLDELIEEGSKKLASVPSGGGGGGAAAPAAGGAAPAGDAAPAAAKEEAKKEESEESDDDMGFGLFD